MPLPELSDEKRAWYILKGYDIRESSRYRVRQWLLNGKRHREDGPAVEFENGAQVWYLDGILFADEKEYQYALTMIDIHR